MEYDIIVPTIGNDRVKQIFRVSKGDKNMLPISDILIRSISGYVFIVPVFILYFYENRLIGGQLRFKKQDNLLIDVDFFTLA